MATTTTITKLLIRRGNDSDRKQTILASGEPGWTLDTKRLWIGDGVTPGGFPALSAREMHLHYVSSPPAGGTRWTTVEHDNVNLGAEFLDINVPGLGDTLAGEALTEWKDYKTRGEGGYRWFHPVEKDIRTEKDLIFNRSISEIRHTGSDVLKIASTGDIDIGGAIFIKQDSQGVKTIEMDAGVGLTVFKAASAIFDNSFITHFEDKSVDFNVFYNDSGERNEGEGPTSEGTGIYFAHKNYLSAGFVKIGDEKEDGFGWNTLELSPTIYYTDWENHDTLQPEHSDTASDSLSGIDDRYVPNPTKRAGLLRNPPNNDIDFPGGPAETDGTYSAGFVAPSKRRDGRTGAVGSDGWAPKSIVLQSTRPSAGSGGVDWRGKSFAGNAHLTLEAGLMVYDAGDPELGAYNAYKINQSLDTRATPIFKGIKIQNPDGSPGAPMGVSSGGTGQYEFNAGGVLYTSGNHGDDPTDEKVESMPLELGQIMAGTNSKGVVRTSFMLVDVQNPGTGSNVERSFLGVDYIEPASTSNGQAEGVIRLSNNFCPSAFANGNKADERVQWFGGFLKWNTDNAQLEGRGESSTPKETIRIRGDWDNTRASGGSIRAYGVASGRDNQTLHMLHNHVAHFAYEAAKTAGPNGGYDALDMRTATPAAGADGLGDTNEVEVTTMFAGMTDTSGFFGDLIPTNQTSADTLPKQTPSTYRNNGMAVGGITISRQGHVVGMRSKDFDDRYAQIFNIGSQPRNNSRVKAPGDYVATITNRSLTTGFAAWETAMVQDSSLSSYSSSNYDREVTVFDQVQFNDYGTVHGHSRFNLNDYFYDKQQSGAMMDYTKRRLDDHEAQLQGLGGTAFLRDKTTSTLVTGIETEWNRENKVVFTHNSTSSTNKNYIWSDSDEWLFDVAANKNMVSTLVGDSKRFEWRGKKLGSSLKETMMVLGNTSDIKNTNGTTTNANDTYFALYHDNVATLSYEQKQLKLTDGVTDDASTITSDLIKTSGKIESDQATIRELTVGGENVGWDHSSIYFYDDKTNSWNSVWLRYKAPDQKFELKGGITIVGDNIPVGEDALTVTGTSDLVGNVDITGALDVSSGGSFGGSLSISGGITTSGSITTYSSVLARNGMTVGYAGGNSGTAKIRFYNTKAQTYEDFQFNPTLERFQLTDDLHITGDYSAVGNLALGSGSTANKNPKITFYDKDLSYNDGDDLFSLASGLSVTGIVTASAGLNVTQGVVNIGSSTNEYEVPAIIKMTSESGDSGELRFEGGQNNSARTGFHISTDFKVHGDMYIGEDIKGDGSGGHTPGIYMDIGRFYDRCTVDMLYFNSNPAHYLNVPDHTNILKIWYESQTNINDWRITDVDDTDHYLLHSGNFTKHMGDVLTEEDASRFMPATADITPDKLFVKNIYQHSTDIATPYYATFTHGPGQNNDELKNLYTLDIKYFAIDYASDYEDDAMRADRDGDTGTHVRSVVELDTQLNRGPMIVGAIDPDNKDRMYASVNDARNQTIPIAAQTLNNDFESGNTGYYRTLHNNLKQPIIFGTTAWNEDGLLYSNNHNGDYEGYATHISIAQNGDYGFGHASGTLTYTSWAAHAWYTAQIVNGQPVDSMHAPTMGKTRAMALVKNQDGWSDGLYVNGDIVGFYDFSDRRLKENIVEIDSNEALDKVNKLQAVRFDWIQDVADKKQGRQVGLIAQDVEEHVPEVVKTTKRLQSGDIEEADYKHIDYDKLVPMLIESIKVLTARVEKLESQNN